MSITVRNPRAKKRRKFGSGGVPDPSLARFFTPLPLSSHLSRFVLRTERLELAIGHYHYCLHRRCDDVFLIIKASPIHKLGRDISLKLHLIYQR